MCTTVDVARWFLVDGMRRVTGKRPSGGAVEARVGAVRRVLFEPIDHRQTALDLEAENREIRHEAAARWNFDFATETPLEGRFEWSPVGEGEAVHPSYDLRSAHLRHLPTTNLAAARPASATTTTVTEVSTSTDRASSPEKPLCVSPTSTGAGSSKKPIQRKVTDFMTQRKRTAVKTSTPTKPSPKSKVRRTATTTYPTT